MHDDRFALLKDIDAFTTDMFNRIISFQEKDHPAWDQKRDFTTRIEGLPLHNLIFSNPDRDPNDYGPTVAPYYPLRSEMIKLAHYAHQLAEHPVIVDWYPGNGFIGSLLARENLHVLGIQANSPKPNQIELFYDNHCYHFCSGDIPKQCDVVFASWIPSHTNPTPQILSLQPKLIVYVFTEHADPQNNRRQTGTDDMFDNLQDQYRLLDSWSVTRPKNLLHEIWPDLTPNIEETRITKIYIDTGIAPDAISTLQNCAASKIYDWEKELQFALLALEAKQELQMRGVL